MEKLNICDMIILLILPGKPKAKDNPETEYGTPKNETNNLETYVDSTGGMKLLQNLQA